MHGMWRRLAQIRLHALWRQFPAVLVLGARQVGKTTLARQTFPALPYCDLEEPLLRGLFTDDPTFQIQQRALPSLIIDEAQAVPGVFDSLHGIIDEHRKKNGRFLLFIHNAREAAVVDDVRAFPVRNPLRNMSFDQLRYVDCLLFVLSSAQAGSPTYSGEKNDRPEKAFR